MINLKEFIKTKYGILTTVILVLISVICVYQFRLNRALNDLLELKQTELLQAKLEIGKAQTLFAKEKTVHALALNDLDNKLKAEIKKHKEVVVQYGKLLATYQTQQSKLNLVTKVLLKERSQVKIVDVPNDIMFIKNQDGTYQKIESISFSYKDFRLTVEGDALKKTFNYKINQRFLGQIVETRTKLGTTNHYIRLFELNDKNKTVEEVKLTKFETISVKGLAEKLHWWNPKLDLSGDVGFNTKLDAIAQVSLGMSLGSYGVTKDDISFRFVRIGVGYGTNKVWLGVSPIQYNLGKVLPLVSNLWIGPSIGWNPGISAINATIGLSVVF